MTCRDFEQLWQLRFDEGGIPVSSRELAHAAQCEHCRIRLEEYRLLADSLLAWRAELPEVDLAGRVTRALGVSTDRVDPDDRVLRSSAGSPLREPVAAVEDRLIRGIFAVLAAAACITGISLFVGSVSHDSPPDVVATEGPPTGAAQVGSPSPVDLAVPRSEGRKDALHPPAESDREFAHRTRQAYGPVARRAAGAVGQVFTLIGPSPPAGEIGGQDPGNSQQQRLLTGLQQQFQPIGRSVGEALDFLWMAGERQAAP